MKKNFIIWQKYAEAAEKINHKSFETIDAAYQDAVASNDLIERCYDPHKLHAGFIVTNSDGRKMHRVSIAILKRGPTTNTESRPTSFEKKEYKAIVEARKYAEKSFYIPKGKIDIKPKGE